MSRDDLGSIESVLSVEALKLFQKDFKIPKSLHPALPADGEFAGVRHGRMVIYTQTFQ
jgi:hypothetical protein